MLLSRRKVVVWTRNEDVAFVDEVWCCYQQNRSVNVGDVLGSNVVQCCPGQLFWTLARSAGGTVSSGLFQKF